MRRRDLRWCVPLSQPSIEMDRPPLRGRVRLASRWICAPVAIGLQCIALSVWGQDSIPDCTRDNICTGMYERAQAQSGHNNYADAARLYKLAYQVIPDPRILYSVARVLHKDGRTNDARQYYQKFIDSPLDDPAQKQKAREFLGMLPPTEKPEAPSIHWRTPSPPPEKRQPATPVVQQLDISPPRKRSFPVGAGVLLATGGAGLLTGIILGGMALSAKKQVVAGDGPFDQALYDRGVTLNRAAISLDVIGGVMLAGGVVWTAVWLGKHRPAALNVTLSPAIEGRIP